MISIHQYFTDYVNGPMTAGSGCMLRQPMHRPGMWRERPGIPLHQTAPAGMKPTADPGRICICFPAFYSLHISTQQPFSTQHLSTNKAHSSCLWVILHCILCSCKKTVTMLMGYALFTETWVLKITSHGTGDNHSLKIAPSLAGVVAI